MFTNEYWKSASVGVAVTVLDPNHNFVPMVSTISITHLNGTPYPMPITDRTDPPMLTATTWVTPACVQWYQTDSGGGIYGFKKPIGAGTVTGSAPPYTLAYTFPNPVPCDLVNPAPPLPSWNYFRVEVFDAGRFPHASPDWPQVSGDCQ